MQLTHFYPQALLWLLGPQYRDLRFEVQLAVAAGAVSFFSSVLWSIHSARRFVYWWNVVFSIVLTLLVQVLFFIKADVSTGTKRPDAESGHEPDFPVHQYSGRRLWVS